jgi:hypothetical protein
MKRNKIKGIAGKQQQSKNIDQLSTKPNVTAVIMTSNHEVDHDEHHAEDNATDDDSDDS